MVYFQRTWENVMSDGKKIIPPLALKEIRCLLVHIRRGCLSGILPGRGTNRNERLHKDINTAMKSSRYGVELAYGLITVSMFNHNENIRAKREKRCALPIVAYYSTEIPTCIEKFGLHTTSASSADQPLQLPSKLKMRELKHNEIQDTLQSMNVDIDLSTVEKLQHNGIELAEDEAILILSQAVSAYFVTISLVSFTTTADFTAANAFFLSSMCLTQGLMSTTNAHFNNEQMEPLLASWNLKRVPSLGDGNCLFRSVAFGLIHQIQQGHDAIKDHMISLGIPEEHLQNLEYIQRLLRTKMVEEWEQNIDHYQGYITQDL